jgi:hypothetical protein
MAARFARLIEKTISVEEVPTSESASTEKISLNGANKFSIQVVATIGDSIAHLEGSNVEQPSSDVDWTEIDNESIAEGANHIFEQPNVSYRWARITIENDDAVDVSADCVVLVIGDAL